MSIKNIKNKFWLTLVAIIFTLTSCVHNKKDATISKKIKTEKPKDIKNIENTKEKIKKEKDVITIWIHGTKMMGLQDHIFKDFFFRIVGLHNINEYLDKHKITKLAKQLSEQNTHRFEYNNFYVYGWSGELSHEARKIAAKDLHRVTLELIQNCVIPKIRLITHSHGGNVALNMTKINKQSQDKISIYELILLACPVQQKTAHFVSEGMFEKVYSLYSELDMLQIIDPQGLHKFKNKEKKPLFSERMFAPEEKITQAKIRINGRSIMHIEFITERFAKLLPNILYELDQWDQQEAKEATITNKRKCLSINVDKKNTVFNKKYLVKRKTKYN